MDARDCRCQAIARRADKRGEQGIVTGIALTDQAGETWRLPAALARGAVVLLFYRGDW
jgi:hypothetical protein